MHPTLLDRVAALRYVSADNAPTYRAIVAVFYEAKQRYRIELSPAELLEEIKGGAWQVEVADAAALDRHLEQLVEWTNLFRTHDTAAVARIDDFYKKRFRYHLSAVGEAAHRAVLDVERAVGRAGSLQTAMLAKVRDALVMLTNPALAGDARASHGVLHDLCAAFGSLTEEATRFIGDLGREMEEARVDEERFHLYKHALLQYITRFVAELRELEVPIKDALAAVDDARLALLLAAAVTAAGLPPSPDGSDPAPAWIEATAQKFRGVVRWFLGDERGREPTVQRLYDVAVRAVLQLARSVDRLNERRVRPIDRAADFRALARFFARTPDDAAAHALSSVAFGLYPARHFHLAELDPEAVPPSTSWWDAPPVDVPVRLRTRGQIVRTGRAAAARDHSESKLWLAQLRRREEREARDALARFVGRGPIELGALATVSDAELDVLLGLLDEVLAAPRGDDGVRATTTSDGRLEVALLPPRDASAPWVSLEAPRGRLRVSPYRLEVRSVAVPAARAAVREAT